MAVHPGIDGRGVVFSTASFAACACSGDTAPPAGCPQMRTDAHPIASPGSTLCVGKHRTNTVVCFLPEIDAQSSRLRRPAARRCVREQRWRGPGAQHGDAEDDVHCAKNTAGPRVLKNLGTLPPALDGSGMPKLLRRAIIRPMVQLQAQSCMPQGPHALATLPTPHLRARQW